MNVMSNDKPVGIRGSGRGGVTLKEVLGVLDQIRRVHEVVLGIEIEIDNMVAEGSHVGLAAGCRIAIGIRRAHVGREEAQDVVEGYLVVVQLVQTLGSGNDVLTLGSSTRAKIQMAPGVRNNLVTSRVHTLDQTCPRVVAVVDLAFAEIVSSNHETRDHTVRFKSVQDRFRVDVRAIIKSQGKHAVDGAVIDACSAVWHTTELGTSDIGSNRAWGLLKCVGTRSVVE